MTSLGVNNSIELNLCNLMIYEKGGFFKSNRNSEKENNIFATLIVQLPTFHEGGQLIVKQKGKNWNNKK